MKADEDAAEAAVGGEEGEGGGGNVTEMEIMENFVRSLVEDWRYQGRITDRSHFILDTLHSEPLTNKASSSHMRAMLPESTEAAGPCLPNGPIMQLSPYFTRNPCTL